MRNIAAIFAIVLAAFSIGSSAQNLPFSVELEEFTIPGMPAVQSFAWAQHNGKWLLIGGRTDGLHQRQPFAAFLDADNNTVISVIDPETQQVWQSDMLDLPVNLQEQLKSTNMNFTQVDETLYIIGGYGFSATAGDHITHAALITVNVPAIIDHIISASSITEDFEITENAFFANTGGHLAYLNNKFYLCGGQYFEGRYNPMGPDHGPGFIQNYADAVHVFNLNFQNSEWQIQNVQTFSDSEILHRRDYNLIPQIFEDGSNGLVMFSGVFQPNVDLPWHSNVKVTESSYQLIPDFEQLLSQYHSARIPIYSESNNEQYNLFFGGISRYYYNENNQLMDDPNVPFVTTISASVRNSDGTWSEFKIGDMPELLGASSEFIPAANMDMLLDEIIKYDVLPEEQILLGYIVGGIESSEPNIFFINDGAQSVASTKIYKVYIHPGNVGLNELAVTNIQELRARVFPNPVLDSTTLEFHIPISGEVEITLLTSKGETVNVLYSGNQMAGDCTFELDLGAIAAGDYFVQIQSPVAKSSVRIIKK